jgi:hypothetical protein
MATTPRKTQTPGAKKETTTTAQTSTDDVMDAVLGKLLYLKTKPKPLNPNQLNVILSLILTTYLHSI